MINAARRSAGIVCVTVCVSVRVCVCLFFSEREEKGERLDVENLFLKKS